MLIGVLVPRIVVVFVNRHFEVHWSVQLTEKKLVILSYDIKITKVLKLVTIPLFMVLKVRAHLIDMRFSQNIYSSVITEFVVEIIYSITSISEFIVPFLCHHSFGRIWLNGLYICRLFCSSKHFRPFAFSCYHQQMKTQKNVRLYLMANYLCNGTHPPDWLSGRELGKHR